MLSAKAKERRYMMTGVTHYYQSERAKKVGLLIIFMFFTADYWDC